MASNTSLCIYNYVDAAEFLRDLLGEIRQRRPSYSVRSWATRLGMSNSGSLSKILSGQRPVPLRLTLLIAEQHGVTPQETAYLQVLVACNGRISTESLSIAQSVFKNAP